MCDSKPHAEAILRLSEETASSNSCFCPRRNWAESRPLGERCPLSIAALSSDAAVSKRPQLAPSTVRQNASAPPGCRLQCGSEEMLTASPHRSSQRGFHWIPPGTLPTTYMLIPGLSSSGSGTCRSISPARHCAKSAALEGLATAARHLRMSDGFAMMRLKGLSDTTNPDVLSRRWLGSWQYSKLMTSPLSRRLRAVRRHDARPPCSGLSQAQLGWKLWFSKSPRGSMKRPSSQPKRRLAMSCHAASRASRSMPLQLATCSTALTLAARDSASGGLWRPARSCSWKKQGKVLAGSPTSRT
mmetsp:Transcript_58208/g.182709  ORF Transcript_58208/g.182709 Transcript_58208/m.182709 type:complete len:300 (+) Transcript_58208:59-958(+)